MPDSGIITGVAGLVLSIAGIVAGVYRDRRRGSIDSRGQDIEEAKSNRSAAIVELELALTTQRAQIDQYRISNDSLRIEIENLEKEIRACTSEKKKSNDRLRVLLRQTEELMSTLRENNIPFGESHADDESSIQ